MWVLNIAITVIFLWIVAVLIGSNVYKHRVIADYEARTPRIYEDFVGELQEIKSLFDIETRAAREPLIRNRVNDAISKYSRKCRTHTCDHNCEECKKKNQACD